MKANIFELLENPDTALDRDLLDHCTNGSLRTLLDRTKEMADVIRFEMCRRGMLSKEEYQTLKDRETL
jgi:hypothetical protein